MRYNILMAQGESVQTQSQDTAIQTQLLLCYASIDAISGNKHLLEHEDGMQELDGLFKNAWEEQQKLMPILNSDPQFGERYVGKFFHDFTHITDIYKYKDIDPITPESLEIYCSGSNHMFRSIELELHPSVSAVEPVLLIEEAKKIIDLDYERVHRTGHKITVNIKQGEWLVLSNEHGLYRILLNHIVNSHKSIYLKNQFGLGSVTGDISFSARRDGDFVFLEIQDTGIGFSRFFDTIKYHPSEKDIPLKNALQAGNGISWFQQAGISGTGSGLGTCQHLSELIGAEIFIRNPDQCDNGSIISIKMPSAVNQES
jgi:hypothetical protein